MTDRSKLITQLTKDFIQQGRLIEAGWQAMRIIAIPATASAVQVAEMRKAFFCGSQHLFSSIMGVLEPGSEPTEQDLQVMTAISIELAEFVKELKAEDSKFRTDKVS